MKKEKSSAETRIWDWLSAFLLICALFTAASRLVASHWTDELYLVQTVTVIGAVLGMILGISRFSPRLVFFFALAYGAFVIPWQMGLSLHLDIEWKVRLQIIWGRMLDTIDLVTQSKEVQDNTLFVFFMALLFWAVSLYAGYCLIRYGLVWRAVLPAGLVMLVIHTYDSFFQRRVWYLIFYLFFMLILLARFNFVQRHVSWKRNRILMAPDINLDWLRYAFLAAVLVLVLSWAVPAMAESFPPAREIWLDIRRPWVKFQDQMSNAFASLRATVGLVTEYYDPTLTLGRGSQLSDTPVLSVKVPSTDKSGFRYYWRAMVYDRYENGQWNSTLNEIRNLNPQSPGLQFPEWQGRTETSFSVTTYKTIGTLITPSQPLWVDQPVKAHLGFSPDGSADLITLQVQTPVGAGRTYEVRSSVATANALQLRAAGTDYPQYIREHYLQLPPSITDRTKERAKQLSQGQETPYDVAVVVTNYLRTYEYSAVIDPPPTNQEVMDWWLFDYPARKGFCQYYASAEVILLRLAGIPARLAVGYAQGAYEADTRLPGLERFDIPNPSVTGGGTYQVRQRDAHAWPEVYFPQIGWVEFEPTASQFPLVRASGLADSGANPEEDTLLEHGPAGGESIPFPTPPPTNLPPSRISGLTLAILGAAILLLAFVVWRIVSYRRLKAANIKITPFPIRLEKGFHRLGLRPPNLLRRWALYVSLSPLVHAYLEINRALKRLGKPAAIYDTPAERAATLARLLPAAAGPSRILLAEYQSTEYSPNPGNAFAATRAGKEIRRLSYRAWLQKIFVRFQEPYVDVR
jgi:transglutaminase-like putative cysteine protease